MEAKKKQKEEIKTEIQFGWPSAPIGWCYLPIT